MRMLSISLGLVQAVLCALEITSGDKPAVWPLLVKIAKTYMFFKNIASVGIDASNDNSIMVGISKLPVDEEGDWDYIAFTLDL